MVVPYTISELPRLERCLGPLVLRRSGDKPNPYSAYGSRGHAFFEAINRAGGPARYKEVLAAIPDLSERELLASFPLEGLPLDPAKYLPEVAFALNLETGTARVLGTGLDRNYKDREPGELVGTVDVVALVDDDCVYVGDFKFLYGVVPSPRRNLQLKTYALAAARAFNRSSAIMEIIRPREDEPPWISRAALDAFELVDIEGEIMALARRGADAQLGLIDVQLTTGDHCAHCKSFEFCDAQGMLASTVTRATFDMVPSLAEGLLDPQVTKAELKRKAEDVALKIEPLLTVANFPTFHQRLKAAEALLEALRDTAKNFVAERAVDLGNGLMYGPADWTEQSLNGPVVWGVIKELYGEKTAWEVVELKVTQKKLVDKVVRKESQRRKEALPEKPTKEERAGTTQDAVMGEIRYRAAERGGWKTYTTKRIREFNKGE